MNSHSSVTKPALLPVGASGGNLHAPDEWVSLPELLDVCEILERTAVAYGRLPSSSVRT